MAAELKVGIGADNSGLSKGLKDAERQISAFVAKVDKIADIGKELQSIGTKMSAALTLPLVALGGAALKAYSELEGVKTAFDRLNNPNLLNDLRKATQNTTADFQLMKGAVQASNFGIPVKELGTLMEFASRRAKDTGESVDYLVNSIVTGIGRKSPLILDNLGISAAALKQELNGVSMEAASVGTVTEAVGRIAQRELQKMGADTLTFGQRMLQIKTIFSNLSAEFGGIIADKLKPLVDWIAKLAEGFQNLSPKVKETIVVVAGIVAAIGPLLVAAGTFMSMLPTILAGIGGLKVAFLALTGPIGLVTAGIIGIVAAVASNWGKIKPYIDGSIKWFKDLYNESTVVRLGIQSIVFAFAGLYQSVKIALGGVWNVFKTFGKTTLELFAGIGQVIKAVLTGSWDEIPSGVARATLAISSGFQALKDNSENMIKAIGNSLSSLSTKIGNHRFVDKKNVSVDKSGISTKVADDTFIAVTDGVKKANNKLKASPVKIDIPIDRWDEATANLRKSFDESLQKAFIAGGEADTAGQALAERIRKTGEIALTELQSLRDKVSPELELLKIKFNEAFAAMVSDSISNSVSDAFGAIGTAIGEGGNVLAALGQSVLSSLGSFLSDLGGLMIKFGLAAAVLGKLELALIAADPASKIGLGLAMAAAGAVLKVAGSAISAAVSNRGGGASSGGGYYSPSGGNGYTYSGGNYNQAQANTQPVELRLSGNDLVAAMDRNQTRNRRIS